MFVNVKFLNGEICIIEMEFYSDEKVRDYLSDHALKKPYDITKLIEYEEKDENKYIFAFIIPVWKYGKEFIKFLEQFVIYSYESHDTIDGSLSNGWAEECRQCALQNGYNDPIIKKQSELYYYFTQINVFLENGLEGNTIVNEKEETAIQVFTDMMIKCHRDIKYHNDYMNFYKKLCKTANPILLENIAKKMIEDCINSYKKEELFEDFIYNDIINRAIILENIGLSNISNISNNSDNIFEGLYHLFDNVEEINDMMIFEDFMEAYSKDIFPKDVMSILKYYINESII